MTLTITLQLGLGISALSTGLALVPFSIAAAVGSTASASLAKRHGRRVLQYGVAVFAIGFALLAAVLESRGPGLTVRALLLPLAVSGLGMGLVIAPLVEVILAGVQHRDAGAASGVLNATGQVGQAVGIAVLGAMYFIALSSPSAARSTHALALTLEGAVAILALCIGVMAFLPKFVDGR